MILLIGAAAVVIWMVAAAIEDERYLGMSDEEIDEEIQYLLEIKRRNKEWRENRK